MTRAELLAAGAALAATPGVALAATPVKIGVNGAEGMAQAFYADDQGFFKARGVDDAITILRNGAAITAAVAGGDLDAGASNVISLAQAKARGVPVSIFAGGALFDASANGTERIVALASGPIRTARDLDGKVVGTPSLSSTAALATFACVDKNGGHSSSIQFIEISEGQMGVALQQGRIAAATLEDPDLNAPGIALRELGPAYSAVAKTYLVTAWFASDAWLAANAATARAVADAISQGGRWAMTNRVAAAGVLEKFTKKKLTEIREIFAPNVTPALLQPVFDAATKYKILPQRINAAEFIWEGR